MRANSVPEHFRTVPPRPGEIVVLMGVANAMRDALYAAMKPEGITIEWTRIAQDLTGEAMPDVVVRRHGTRLDATSLDDATRRSIGRPEIVHTVHSDAAALILVALLLAGEYEGFRERERAMDKRRSDAVWAAHDADNHVLALWDGMGKKRRAALPEATRAYAEALAAKRDADVEADYGYD